MPEPTLEDRLTAVETKTTTLTDQAEHIVRLNAKIAEMIAVLNEAHATARKSDSNVLARRVEQIA